MAPTFSCANATCDNRTRNLRKGRWQKIPDSYFNAKVETEATTHICISCYKESLQARHEAESRRSTRTSPDAALQPVRPRAAPVPELEQLAQGSGQTNSADEDEQVEADCHPSPLLEATPAPMELSAAEVAEEDSDTRMVDDDEVSADSNAEAEAAAENLDQYIRRNEEERGLSKSPGQQGATFLRENPEAGPKALSSVRELLRELWFLKRKTQPFLHAAHALEESGRPPLFDLLAAAVNSGKVPAEHAAWHEIADGLQNMCVVC